MANFEGRTGANANQVFKWRRAFERGEMSEPTAASTALLPCYGVCSM
jgi:transposase-like protein